MRKIYGAAREEESWRERTNSELQTHFGQLKSTREGGCSGADMPETWSIKKAFFKKRDREREKRKTYGKVAGLFGGGRGTNRKKKAMGREE